MFGYVTYAFFWVYCRILYALWLVHFTQLAKRPRQVQATLLKRILRDNKDTQIGQEFGFRLIQTEANYQETVGIQSYEGLKDSLRTQESTGSRLLCAEDFVYQDQLYKNSDPISYPLTASAYRRTRQNVRIAAFSWLKHYGLWRHRVFSILVDKPPSLSLTGLPQGTSVGFIYRNLPRFIRARCIAPQEFAEIRDIKKRYLAHAIVALADGNLTGLLTANPATLMHLSHVIESEFTTICSAIEKGEFPRPERTNTTIQNQYQLRPNPRRANLLRRLRESNENLSLHDYWPKLRGIICWTSGSCSTAIRYLREQLRPGIAFVELANPSASVVGTINIDTRTRTCVPLLRDNFYEFAERSSWESGFADMKRLDEIVVGNEYYVILTTPSGLYRIQTEQIIKVTGKIHETPTFEFVQHSSHSTNVHGEQLAESEVISAIAQLNEKHNHEIQQFLVLCNVERRSYELYIESKLRLDCEQIRFQFDDALSRNSSFWLTQRLTERMDAPEVTQIREGTINTYRLEHLTDGSRDPITVLPHLLSSQDIDMNFADARI